MADHDDELDERFRSLEGVPVPGWRDRVQAKDTDELQLEPDGDGPRRWPPRSSLVLVGAAAAVIALLIGVVAWPSDDDEPVATGASTFGDLPPTDAPLMCPPALLDVGDLFDGVTRRPRWSPSPLRLAGHRPTPCSGRRTAVTWCCRIPVHRSGRPTCPRRRTSSCPKAGWPTSSTAPT